MAICEQSIQGNSPTSTCFAADFLAKASRLQDGVSVSEIQEALSSLKLPESLQKNGLRFYSWRMSSVCYRMTAARRLIPSSPRLLKWGIEPQESKVLKRIYAAYLDGSSMLTIAEQLNREKIEYRDSVTGWNKGRLKHLIDNTKYLGTEVYPPIIDQATYEKIQKTKYGRNTQKNMDKAQDIFKLTVPVRCPSCGDRMRRRHDSRCKCQERWTCENTACRLRIEIPDAELLTALADLLGTVTADSITLPVESPYEPSAEVIRLNNEIGRMLDMAEIYKTVLRSKMTECFRQKYKELGNECCAVQRLKAEVGSTADIAERLNRTVSEIRLYTDKTADIILLNGQIIRKENSHATDNGRPSESGAGNRTDHIGQREREKPIPSPAGGGILPRFH